MTPDELKPIYDRLEWWGIDVSYKAPEQITMGYVFGLLKDLHGCLDRLTDGGEDDG